jgi:hypothetical protein
MIEKIVRSRVSSLSSWLVGFVCGATILIALEHGYEGSWYLLSTMMHRLQVAPPAFGYRILFPLLADQLQSVVPSLTDHNCFIAVQMAIIAVTVYLSGEWARLFHPQYGRLLGYALLALMVCPTIDYWTFYDIAIVGFWTFCYLLLHHRRFLSYMAMLAAATLNHENILLIIPCALAYSWGRMRTSRLLLFAGCQAAAWAGVRWAVTSLVPAGRLFDNRLWENLVFWKHYSLVSILSAWAILLPWWLIAYLGWKHAPRLLRCSALSLPGLLLVTMLFGRFDEARQFAAFIPTCIGLIACWLRQEGGAIAPLAG